MTADFVGDLISSDGGLALSREAERPLNLAESFARCIRAFPGPARPGVGALPATRVLPSSERNASHAPRRVVDARRCLDNLGKAWIAHFGGRCNKSPTCRAVE